MTMCLFKSLASAQTHSLQERTEEEGHSILSSTATTPPVAVISDVSMTLHSRIKKQAALFKHREYEDIRMLSDLNMEEVINEVDTEVWENVWSIIYGNQSGGAQDEAVQSQSVHVKRIRCLFILSCIMHAGTPSCTFPFQLTLSDFVEANSRSSELMSVLSRVGATAGIDTYKRYQKTVIDRNSEIGCNGNIPVAKFSVATVDNIDKNEPSKRMYCGDQSRGFHGTSIQSVTPKPVTGNTMPTGSSCPPAHPGFYCAPSHHQSDEPPAKRSKSRTRTHTEKGKNKYQQTSPTHLETAVNERTSTVHSTAMSMDTVSSSQPEHLQPWM